MNKYSIKLKNSIEELDTLTISIEELADNWQLPMNITMNLNLALEEIFTNIVNYGFEDKDHHEIEFDFFFENQLLKIIITDNGIAFNPLEEAKKPDLDSSVEDRPIGGLGIHLVKEIMDKLEYKRENDKNKLTLYKEVEK